MKKLLSTVAAILMFCTTAYADGLSGKTLAEGCQKNTLERVACLAYIQGFSDGFVRNDIIMTTFIRENVRSGHLAVQARDRRVEKPTYCADDEMPADVVRRVYLDWAAKHPDRLDRPAPTVLFDALAAAFPCRGAPAAAAAYQAAAWR